MKFTDEELSRVLSAHEGGQLVRFGWFNTKELGVCVAQAARGIRPLDQMQECGDVALAFDRFYRPEISTTELLVWLESQGVA